jgi:hypothetical protein
MRRAYVSVDITDAPELQRLVEAVRLSGQPHVLEQAGETVAIIRPAPTKPATGSTRRPRPRRRRFTQDDPLFGLPGIIDGPGPTDMAANKDRYLVEAYTANRK